MSMQTDCIYGYGFRIYVSDDNLRRFIEKHEPVIATLRQGRELLDWVHEHVSTGKPLDSIKERFFDWDNEATGDCGIYGMIADVMHKETGIVFEYRNSQDEDEDDAILLPETFPWNFNELERSLTMESLEEICKRYIDDLGGQLKPDYIRLEYFG